MNPLDLTDTRILMLLQNDARLTNKEIADKLGKTITPIYERIRRLEQQGYIQRYVAVLDRNKIDKGLVAFTNVQLKEHSHPMLKAFEKDIVKFGEVMECYHMTGVYDYLLKIVVKDINEYQNFIVNKLAKLSNIGTVQSGFVMTEIKFETAYPISLSEKREKNGKSK
ncbi:MAG: Lrp/AsnC family transcriptional regulator [Chitinophagaceae bacterium]|jgi:DNA-binding Lrp family transcriptional regulator|nr:Lrp/AsnC family transcriptional regulator [Chitinophagaceae bacterium]OQY95784.1 MAG: AsnC family transcriptional regulator [Sphingobacteriales bacterium UTBCD1]